MSFRSGAGSDLTLNNLTVNGLLNSNEQFISTLTCNSMQVDDNAEIVGDLTAGNATATTITATTQLMCQGDSVLQGNLACDGDITVDGNAYYNQSMTVGGTLQSNVLQCQTLNGLPVIPIYAWGSTFTGQKSSNVYLNPPSESAQFQIQLQNTQAKGILLVSSSAYSCSQQISTSTSIVNGVTLYSYLWTVTLQGGGSSPQNTNGNISFIIL